MTIRAASLAASLVLGLTASLALAGPAAGQDADTTPLDPNLRGIEFGGRFSNASGDVARFMRFEDLRSGALINRARYTREQETRLVHFEADRVGWRDQHYAASVNQFGRLEAWFDFRGVPFRYDDNTRTMYAEASPGVFRLDDGIQLGIQNRTLTLDAAAQAFSLPFALRSQRDVYDGGLRFHASEHLDVNVRTAIQRRNGYQPVGAGFGFSQALELPGPIDDRTTEIGTSVEWANGGRLARVGYDGSWYTNHADTLIWDSPVRATDLATASSQGRMPRWPTSSSHTLSAVGSSALPGRSRITASVSRSQWLQDAEILPFTINSALTSPPLERSTVEGEAAVTSAMVRFTSRPSRWAWFNATVRNYDLDNRTPVLEVPNQIKYDQAPQVAAVPETEPLSFSRAIVDLEGSFTPWRHGAIRVGYSREAVDRSFRLVEETTDHTLRLAYDVATLDRVTVRADLTRSKRTGSGLDEEVFSDIGEQVSLRQFDIADRTRTQGTLIVTVMPTDLFSVSAWVGGGKDDRSDAPFGLADASFGTYAVGVDAAPRDGVSLGLQYGLERFSSLQRSRQANPPPSPQFTDPTRDWSTDGAERVHTLTASFDVLKGIPRTELRGAFDYSRSRSRYTYALVPNSTLVTPVPLPDITNAWQSGTIDVRYMLRRQIALGLGYRYDRFTLDDYALNPSTIDRLVFGTTLLMGITDRPYTANTVFVKLAYLW
ncbi:MAG: MtrB/PioB family outer membrane beta-barrel protein [Vicinamibacteraceae bacterium]